MKIRYFILLFTLFGFVPCYADGEPEQLHSSRFLVQFPVGQAAIDLSYRDNYYAVEELKRFFGTVDLSKVDTISVIGSSSPEGSEPRNLMLSMRRAESLRDLLCATFSSLPKSKVQIYAKGDTWAEMLKLISRDEDFPLRGQTLAVLETDQAYKSRFGLMRFLQYDESSKYLRSVILPQLRNATVITISYSSDKPFVVKDSKKEYVNNQKFIQPPASNPQFIQPPASNPQFIEGPSAAIHPSMDSAAQKRHTSYQLDPPQLWGAQPLYYRKPLFALKTNLLFDAATLLNAEIEIPLAKRWSLAAEFIFPWWLNEERQNAIQVYNANLELRYWFKPKTDQKKGLLPHMTGWFMGVYGGGGLYDLEYQAKGYQGEFFIAAGLSAGYVHSIGRSLRMEYSLGVGYMVTDYRRYESRFSDLDNSWHLYRQETGRFTWIGPTRAKISLVWMLSRNARKGGLK